MNKKIKLLIVCGFVTNGGVGSFILKVLKSLDFNKFDVYVNYYAVEEDGIFQKEIKKILPLEKIYVFPFSVKNIYQTIKDTKKLYQEHNFDILHSHCTSLSLFHFYFAKKYGIKTRIMHSHSTMFSETKLKACRNQLMFLLTKPFITHRVACSEKAGKFLFRNKEFKIINNAVDCSYFKFNEEYRSKIRKEFNIPNDAFVLGHISNFAPVKNHKFIVDVFNEIYHKNTYLLLVGAGEKLQEVINQVEKLNLQKQVIFAGVRGDVNRFYSAMDCFVFPSFFEGLGLVVIEAQASGLPCIISQTVPKEAIITGIAKQLSLNNIEQWISEIENIQNKKNNRVLFSKKVKEQGYDMKNEVKNLESLYLTKIKEK